MARALQGAELLKHAPSEVSDAFIATRLSATMNAWGSMFGTVGGGMSKASADKIVERARVVR